MGKKRFGFVVLFYILCLLAIGMLVICIKFENSSALKATVKGKLIAAAAKTQKVDPDVAEAVEQLTEMAESGVEGVSEATESEGEGILTGTADIALYDKDGAGRNYAFTYGGETFNAYYNGESWTIYNSYLITIQSDMKIICQALIDVHPILGRDRQSYRTPDDMVYEWVQHNIAFQFVPSDSQWYEKARDVNLDPDDQGRTIEEIYEDRTGEELDINKIWQKLKEYY